MLRTHVPRPLLSPSYDALITVHLQRTRATAVQISSWLNAGLCAPEYCWETAVRRMIADRVPAIFTDYMRASCEMPLQLWGDLVQEHGGTILEPEVNPFRQPWSRPDDSNSDSSGRYTCMANGHIYGWRF